VSFSSGNTAIVGTAVVIIIKLSNKKGEKIYSPFVYEPITISP